MFKYFINEKSYKKVIHDFLTLPAIKFFNCSEKLLYLILIYTFVGALIKDIIIPVLYLIDTDCIIVSTKFSEILVFDNLCLYVLSWREGTLNVNYIGSQSFINTFSHSLA